MTHKHMKLYNKKKKSFFSKAKLLLYILIIYIFFSYTFYFSFRNTKRISNEEFINFLVKTGNTNILEQYKLPNLVNSTIKLFLSIDLSKPVTILNSSIFKYGTTKTINNQKKINLEYNDDYSNMNDLKNVSDYIHDPNPKNVDTPVLYIYNSHQLENYSSDNLDIYGITPNVMMASYVLREQLLKLGINSIVEEANMSDILSKNGWNYSYSYQASRSLIISKKEQYPSLKYFIDIHRDSVGKNLTTVQIGNLSYAKVLFVIGLDYTGWESNYQFVSKLNQMIESSYPGLSRGIMKKTGLNVNGVYNQDISPNCILIEIGGVENKIDEVYQTMNVLAEIIHIYIVGDSS